MSEIHITGSEFVSVQSAPPKVPMGRALLRLGSKVLSWWGVFGAVGIAMLTHISKFISQTPWYGLAFLAIAGLIALILILRDLDGIGKWLKTQFSAPSTVQVSNTQKLVEMAPGASVGVLTQTANLQQIGAPFYTSVRRMPRKRSSPEVLTALKGRLVALSTQLVSVFHDPAEEVNRRMEQDSLRSDGKAYLAAIQRHSLEQQEQYALLVPEVVAAYEDARSRGFQDDKLDRWCEHPLIGGAPKEMSARLGALAATIDPEFHATWRARLRRRKS